MPDRLVKETKYQRIIPWVLNIRSQDHKSSKRVGGVALLLSCLVVLFLNDPAESSILPSCPFRTLTGFDCPGCGTLRGAHRLLHGNILAALDLNLVMVLMLPYLCVSFFLMLPFDSIGRRMTFFYVPSKWIWGLLLVILVFWVARNIPVYPFVILAS